jgi:lipopolysaccharide transport system ATP-binding protein
VRVINQKGATVDTVDIRNPVGIEMEYDVLTANYLLYPHFTVRNEEGINLFVSIDADPDWVHKPRPVGHYRSVGWIPGNLLAEGTVVIGPAMRTEEPRRILHFHERDAVAFHVVESPDGDTARVAYPGRLPGVVRPMLEWETRFTQNGSRPW